MDELLIWYTLGTFFLAFFVLAITKTNMIVELKSWLYNMPVIWMHYKSQKPKKVIPHKIERGWALFKDKATKRMLVYPLNMNCIKDTGTTKEAIIFEDMCMPVDFRFMNLAAKARRKGIPDYTQFEIAVGMKRLENEIGPFNLKDPITLEDEDGERTEYPSGLDMVKKELRARGVNPWALLDGDIKSAYENKYYHMGADGFDLFENMSRWYKYNLTPEIIDARIQSREIAAKEDANFGRTLPHIEGGTILLILAGLGLLFLFLSQGGGIGGVLGKINLSM